MDTAVGAAAFRIRKLSDDMVAAYAYADSSEFVLNFMEIKQDLINTASLLREPQGRATGDDYALQSLLVQLGRKVDEAEIALDDLHYFIIKDQIDSTTEAYPVDPGSGNWLPFFFSCSCINGPQKGTKSDDSGGHAHGDGLKFDTLSIMSMKIKSVAENIHSICTMATELIGVPVKKETHGSAFIRWPEGSTIRIAKLYGRTSIFGRTIDYITKVDETLSVLPIVGPGGIGKTAFTQYLYNDIRTEQHFTLKVWVSVSTYDFDVLHLTQKILACMPATEEQGSNTAHETSNLSTLQEYITQRLKSKRVLVVLDDIWKCDSKEDWQTLLAPFTEAKGCMVLVTTRFPILAEMMKTVDPLELRGLESYDFFEFFEACTFGELDGDGHYDIELRIIARKIAYQLKGYPLAAKTASRLLKEDFSREHWMGVLENREWENRQNENDFMSALNISYDYLPFFSQKCFSYCALFPKGHKFSRLEMNRFLCAVSDNSFILTESDNSYFDQLVDYGFLMKGDDFTGDNYVMHDFLHDLSRSVSAQECLNISGLDFKADRVPKSIRHVSITLEDIYDEKFQEEMSRLKTWIDIENLRTLMIFREYEGRIAEVLKDTFKGVNNLNILFIVMKSLDDLPQNFSKLIHLQYLKFGSPYGIEMALPSTLSRFYHMQFLDLENWHGSSNLPKDIGRLVNLQNFVARKEIHSSIPEVGKMKYLQELKEFCVKKESVGYELRELGALSELGGELRICNLESVVTKEEANSARLMSKRNLGELTLVWGKGQQVTESDILDGLQPHHNLRALGIIDHGGSAGPSWLCHDISVKVLESLHLEGLSWSTLPPFGQLEHLKELYLKTISGVRQLGPNYGGLTDKSFIQLKKIVLDDMPELVEWIVEPDCQMFPRLESIECRACPNLCVMPFSDCSCTDLRSLIIDDCPKLSLLPVPLSSALADFSIVESGSKRLTYSRKALVVCGYNGALDFCNLDKVENMSIADISHISLTDFEKLKSLRRTAIGGSNNMTSKYLDGSVVFRSVQNEDHVERVIRFPTSSSLQTLSISGCTGMVLLPAEDGGDIQKTASLHSVTIFRCGKLFSRWPMGEAGEEAQTMKPFPASLKKLGISSESSIGSMSLLSNLTSLTHLTLQDCVKLTVDGFNPLITVNLKVLVVFNYRWDTSCPESIAAGLLSEVANSRLMPAGSFQLEQLKVDSISAVLVSPICNLVASTLHTLIFCHDQRAKSFTEEHEKALQLLTSLRHLRFDGCGALQSLPRGLHRLYSLQDLDVLWCHEIRSIPKEGFPVSLRNLRVRPCSADVKEQIEKLRRTNPDLSVLYE